MKRNLLHFIFVSLACVGFAEARFYIGIDGGYVAAPRVVDPKTLGTSNEVKFVSSSTTDIKNAFKIKYFQMQRRKQLLSL